MEIKIKKLKQKTVIGLVVILAMGFSSCSSEEIENTPFTETYGKSNLVVNPDGTESLILNTGEVITLEDTTTYVLDFNQMLTNDSTKTEDISSSTRGVYYTGFDRKFIEKKNKKYLLKGLEKYGIDPNTIYVGKYNTYYKDLPARSGYSILPSNKKYLTEPTPCMGFNPPSLTNIGYHISSYTSTVETAMTYSFYVVSDASGIKWNKNVPCNPEDYIWFFQYVVDE